MNFMCLFMRQIQQCSPHKKLQYADIVLFVNRKWQVGLSRIYSHVTHSYNYGFKGLFLGYHDGKSLFGLDLSLHGEKGKDKEKPYGLTKKQSKKRFKVKRPKKSFGQQRVNEYFISKTEMQIL